MEILEMYCDLILARFGLVTQLKELDNGIAESISSIIWVTPRLLSDVAELKIISDMLTLKYGKVFADSCRAAVPPSCVSEKLQHKMSIQAPPKLLVEKYLIEIAKIYDVDYEPDQSIMKEENRPEGFLIDLGAGGNNLDGGSNMPQMPPNPGFIAYPQPPQLPIMPFPPFNYPQGSSGNVAGSSTTSFPSAPFNYNIPPVPQLPPQHPSSSSSYPSLPSSDTEKKDLNVNFINVSVNYKNYLFVLFVMHGFALLCH